MFPTAASRNEKAHSTGAWVEHAFLPKAGHKVSVCWRHWVSPPSNKDKMRLPVSGEQGAIGPVVI
jgi:hypothetical protein